MPIPRVLPLIAAILLRGVVAASSQVIINEIHYHPVEEPAFDAAGNPVLDLTDDVHEFVEIYNTGPTSVDLANWHLDDGVTFAFPPGTVIAAGGYRVIARNPTRIQTVYGIANVLGPYNGVLSNRADTIKLKNASGNVVDSVSYSSESPWPVSADALGAGSAFYGISFSPYQYRGRSLERVSVAGGSNDPANWIASPLSPGPSPAAPNSQIRAEPKPVVVEYSVSQASDESSIIRSGETVNVEAAFSSSTSLSSVQLEWFVDNIESTSEARSTINMHSVGGDRYATDTPVPGQIDRSIVRWRIRANRGSGIEVVSPRPDDPQIAPIGTGGAREAWHGYFVEPVRTSSKPIYDFFISNANVANLDSNISQNPRRVTSNGYPRDDPKDGYYPPNQDYNPVNYPSAGQPHWDGIVPAVFVRNGAVFDITARYHGSRYQRSSGKNSWKFGFPSSRLMDGKQRILVTEKGSTAILGMALVRAAGLPAAYAQFVDFYKNGEGVTQRCEISDSDEETISQYQKEQKLAHPQNPPIYDGLGIVYKSKGLDGNEGPYGWANGQPLPATGVWSSLDRYIHSFPSQLNDWIGNVPLQSMIDAVWAARGDRSLLSYPSNYGGANHTSQVNVPANVNNLRAYLAANWDIDKMLTYLAIRNWCAPWDDKFHNYYVYLQPDGKWTMMPWDFDNEMNGGSGGDGGYDSSIFAGRKDDAAGTYSNNSRGPNWFKDHFLRAYESEYKERLFSLNNTLLSPANVQQIAAANGISVPSVSWLNSRFSSVNAQCNPGSWQAPLAPINLTPVSGSGVVPPMTLMASAYAHSSGNTVGGHAHAQTQWEIRRADRSYAEPVYNVSTTVNLTSLPLPFNELEFGQTYYWRVTYFDANDHPSPPSSETAFGFGPQPSEITLIALDDTWKYNYTSTFSDSTWAQSNFNDGAWAAGPGALALENDGTQEPIRTTLPAPGTLTPAGRAYYFRKHFDFPGNPATSTVRIRHLIDDGCVIWINGQKVHRYFMNEQANYTTAAFSNGGPGEASFQFADAVANTNTWAWVDPRPFLVQGDNVIAVEVHQTSGSSSDIVFALEMTGTVITNGGDIALNEIMADNRGAVGNGASNPDYIEIRNNTASPVSLSGWSLSDDVTNPARFVFPAGTSIPAAGRLVVWCDSNFTDPGLHTGFALSRNGQAVALFEGTNVRDFLTFGPQARDLPIGRVADGIGVWTLIQPSPGSANVAVSLGSNAGLKVNEWMANPRNGEDWFELFNSSSSPVAIGNLWLSDTLGSAITQIPPHSYIAGNWFARFEADGQNDGGNHANFKLSVSGDRILVLAENGTNVIDSVNFGAQGLGVSEGRFPDGALTLTSFPETKSPGASNWKEAEVVINEALTNSVEPLEDAVELRNRGGASVNIGGWWLSDDPSNPKKFRIPSGTVVAAGGLLVLNESQFGTGPNTFALSSLGDEIILSAVDGAATLTGFRSQVKFGGAAEDVSFGRVETSVGSDFFPERARTLGLPNAGPEIGPVIINEISYHPPDVAGADNSRDEFIELHNVTTSAIDLTGWELKDAADYAFPVGSTILPGDYLIVVGFDPNDAGMAAAFRVAHSLSTSVPLHGPYAPKLSNFSARIELARPGVAVGNQIPRILVDRVEYTDYAPWPTAADGQGSTLQRVDRTAFGNEPANWSAAVSTPGAVNAGQTPTLDSDGDGMPDAWELANGFNRFDPADGDLDRDGDGQSNAAEFAAGTDPNLATDVLDIVVAIVGADVEITFPVKAGKSYTVQVRDSLGSGQWQRLVDLPTQASDGTKMVTDSSTSKTRFYRVVTPQVP